MCGVLSFYTAADRVANPPIKVRAKGADARVIGYSSVDCGAWQPQTFPKKRSKWCADGVEFVVGVAHQMCAARLDDSDLANVKLSPPPVNELFRKSSRPFKVRERAVDHGNI